MSATKLSYSVEDRSILLPHYKRWLVEPTLPFIPERLSPNTITHLGHLICLAALVLLVHGGSPFIVAALINLYCWADNADGAHARRTKQTSPTGEFLDHGLDLLNCTYVAIMTVVALGLPPYWSVAAAVVVPAAAAIIYWEQAETGTFQLGMFNQIESIACLSVVLCVRGVIGASINAIGAPVLAFTTLVAVIGIAHSVVRVIRKKGRLTPFVAFAAFGAAVALVTLTGALGTVAAIAVGTSGFIFLGVRQLHLRVKKVKPLTEYSVITSAAFLGALASAPATAHGLELRVALAGTLIFAVLAFARTVTTWSLLTRTVRAE
jgi:phosphatidylglycerophosphate synthase